MIEQADVEMVEWLAPALDGAVVTFAPPLPHRDGAGVSVYLVELFDVPAARGLARPTAHVGLRYLVTSWAETHEIAHRLLGRALAAASDRSDVEVQLDPPGFELWFSLGVKPQACFFLRLVTRERPSGPPTDWRTVP